MQKVKAEAEALRQRQHVGGAKELQERDAIIAGLRLELAEQRVCLFLCKHRSRTLSLEQRGTYLGGQGILERFDCVFENCASVYVLCRD